MTVTGQQGNLNGRVRAVWRRGQLMCFAEGAIFFLRWGLMMSLAGILVDWLAGKWLAGIPAPGRAVILAAVLGVSVYKAWRGGWKNIRAYNATRTALQIEERRGGMKSLLVTALQIQDATRRHGTSDELCDMVCREAEELAGQIRPDETVRFQLLRRPALITLAAVLLFAGLAAVQGPLLLAGLGRIFTPWLSVNYPTRTQLQLVNGDIVVQEGKPVCIAARVSGIIPKQAKIALRTGSGRARIRILAITNAECEYRIETAFRGFEYQLKAGDACSPWHSVDVITAPRIERAELMLDYPEYTARPSETVNAMTVNVPETTGIRWTLSLDRAVCQASVNLPGRDPVPLEISADGLTVKMQQAAVESMAYSFTWVEKGHGFCFTSPSYYLQVSPDRPPRVELTSPKGNVYATLGRRLDLAFRGRDDHGIGESVIAYRVDKTEEERVPFVPAAPIDGIEQVINWDYRNVLTNLSIGQTVAFAIELSDRYPPPGGPHRARSEVRRMQFMSREDYLAQVEKQKNRLLAQLKTIYKEERSVHELVMRLDPSDPVFVQTCQLEAVRQDLMRERLNGLAGQMKDLAGDLEANSITNEPVMEILARMCSDLRTISTEHVGKAAASLRKLASSSNVSGSSASQVHASDMVDSSARELGLLVMQIGFADASDVMAREMHAVAQTQAGLRLRTTMAEDKPADLAEAQERLGVWLSRLFGACPQGRESTVEEALVEFTLTRLVKQMVKGGIEARLQKAAALIREGNRDEAGRLQAEAIAAMLKAEFRLRVGAEREALAVALDLFLSQEGDQRNLRLETKAGMAGQDREKLAGRQAALHRNLQVLLMPEIPAFRVRLFDDAMPPTPPVGDLLAAADGAMTDATSCIEKGDVAGAEKAQLKAESSFASLAELTRKRILALTQVVRIERMTYGAQETNERLDRFIERQLSLLEKTEDAAADKSKSDYLADQEDALAAAVEELHRELAERAGKAGTPLEESPSLLVRIDDALQLMKQAVPFLKENNPGEAIGRQNGAVSALSGAKVILAEHGANITAYSAMLAGAKSAVVPGPYVAEIEEEQRDMLELARKTRPEDLPGLAIPQKNLVHAVDAILTALDPINHLVESGTVMLFAKDDMTAAGTALQEKDTVEAFDAQSYIVETLEKLRGKINAVIPQFEYLLELTEALHETVPEGILIREAQRALREKAAAKEDAGMLAREQGALRARTASYSGLINEITGLGLVVTTVQYMAEAESLVKAGDLPAAADKMMQAESALNEDVATLLILMKRLAAVLSAPAPEQPIPEQFVLLREVLVMAAQQKDLYRENYAAKPDQTAGFEPKLGEFEKACGPFIERAKLHKNPVVEVPPPKGKAAPVVVEPVAPLPPANLQRNLVAAKGYLAKAAASAKAKDRAKSLENQKKAAESLRHFISEYALKFYINVPGPSLGDPVPSEEFNESEDLMQLFMPGAVTGTRPPDGRLEWEVLGRRERAALNENFARELPLEYRAILKDYYERLAK